MINWNFAEGFHPNSKVWIYQCNRDLNIAEVTEIEKALKIFSKEWTSHKQELKATGTVLFNRFIVLIADESLNSVGGCSIDSSVKFIREIEIHFAITLLDRTKMLFESEGVMKEISLNQLEESISNGTIESETIYFNNTVTTIAEMKNKWRVPVKNSWLSSRLNPETVKS